MQKALVDCLVVGAGPAGLCAATYLGRYLRSVLVLHTGASRAARIPVSHNFPGASEGISGPVLLKALERQALEYGAIIETSRVLALARVGDVFQAEHDGGSVQAKCVILATGILDHNPPVKDIAVAILSGQLRYCPVCDAYEARDKRIGVIGPAEAALKKAMFLRTYSDDVTVICPPMDARGTGCDMGDSAIKFVSADVTSIALRQEAIEVFGPAEPIEFDVIYPALGCNPQSELATGLGAKIDDQGGLVVDKNQQTSVAGLYAAGDVVSELDQIAVAFGHAALAATHVHNTLPQSRRGKAHCVLPRY